MPLFGPPAVAKLAERRDIDGLIKALVRPDDVSRRRDAADALGQIKDPRSVTALLYVLEVRDDELRRKAREALRAMGKAAIEPLIEALSGEVTDAALIGEKRGNEIVALPQIVPFAAQLLGESGDQRAVGPLIATLDRMRARANATRYPSDPFLRARQAALPRFEQVIGKALGDLGVAAHVTLWAADTERADKLGTDAHFLLGVLTAEGGASARAFLQAMEQGGVIAYEIHPDAQRGGFDVTVIVRSEPRPD